MSAARASWIGTLRRAAEQADLAHRQIVGAVALVEQPLTPETVDVIEQRLCAAHEYLSKSKAALFRVDKKVRVGVPV